MAGTVERRIFYVYEYWRPDTNTCFYVGKGHGKRAWEFRRRRHHCSNIIKKVKALGLAVDVRIIMDEMTERAALAFEIEIISHWRAMGVNLANITAGGDGTTGLIHSEETRKIIREKRQNQKIAHSDETRRKIGEANARALIGRKNPEHSARLAGRKHAPEHRAKIIASLTGHHVSEATRKKIAETNTGKKRSAETREKLRLSHTGNKASNETREKMRAAQMRRWAAMSDEDRLKHKASVQKALGAPEAKEKMRTRRR
jgi:trehalose/maltose hydrolase-like predicted phosphorylase